MPTGVVRKNRRTRAVRRKADRAGQLNQRMQRLLESTNAVPWEADASTWQFTYVGPQAVRLLGYPPEAWYEQDFWIEHLHPDDRESAVNFCVEQSKCSTDYDFQYRMVAKDGRGVWIYDVVNVESARGVPKTLTGFMIDITAQKEADANARASEAKFRGAEELAHVGSWEWTIQTGVMQWSDEVSRMVGLDPNEPTPSFEEAFKLVHASDEIMVRERLDAAIAGTQPYDVEFRVARPDGSERVLHSKADVVRDEAGTPVRLTGMIQDVTERVYAEQKARQHLEELAHAGRASTMGELTASLAHELRQPLTAILSNAQAAERFLSAERPNLKELRQILADIIKDDRRAEEVIQRLRALLRKGEQVKAEVLNLNEVIAEVHPLVRSDAVIRGVRIATEFDSRLPSVRGDRIQLQQVILNLLVNGVEAMESCRPNDRTLVVGTARHSPESVVVRIQDRGIGVTDENLEQLFTPFFTTKAHGMGMGLTICRSIIEAHGGRIWATENPDRGLTFHFSLGLSDECPR